MPFIRPEDEFATEPAIARVAMIFVRSKDGRSHTPEEFSSIEDCVEGIRLLAAGLHALAY